MIVLPVTYKKIASVAVGSGGSAAITFSSIPATYTDLALKLSLRTSSTGGDAYIKFNTSSSNFSRRDLYGDGSSAASSSASDNYAGNINNTNQTASTFSVMEIYIPNYAGSTNKSFSSETNQENNATAAFARLLAGLWSQTAAITDIEITPNTGNWVQYSTAVLYGISKS